MGGYCVPDTTGSDIDDEKYIGPRLLKSVEDHAEGSPWKSKFDYSMGNYWVPDTTGSELDEEKYVGVYKKLFNIINPANDNYADSQNFRQFYMWIARDGITDRLERQARHWWMEDKTFYRSHRKVEVFDNWNEKGQWKRYERPPLYTDPFSTITTTMTVCVTATPISQANSRIVMAVSPSRGSGSHHWHIEFPTQRVDSHVHDQRHGKNLLAYPAGALLGRNLRPLDVGHMCGLRRYIFQNQSEPRWIARLVSLPTHIMFLNGVYVRVLWMSKGQMEELMIFAHQCYKAANSRKKSCSQDIAITDHPQCHALADL